MAFSFAFASRLPSAYQPDLFGAGVPAFVDQAEQVSRLGLIALSAFLIAQFDDERHRLGLVLYLAGLALYAASYWAQIAMPDSAWSRSILGFAAPAYTTAIWIAGIGLIGSQSFFTQAAWPGILYGILATIFVASHTSHAILVHRYVY